VEIADDAGGSVSEPRAEQPTAPPAPYVNLYNGSNPLSIRAAPKRDDNYFLILGDWGKSGGPGSCQWKVANMMKAYVLSQSKAGKTLLAIVTVGDNFYWTGATPASWGSQWLPVYGTNDPTSPLHGIPWLAGLGNHDFGDNDPYAYCPHVKPLATYEGQPYGCQQFNRDRNPMRPAGTAAYWMPDYNFHYEIPEADLEFIFVDTNAAYVSNELYSAGFLASRAKCGGAAEVVNFLSRIRTSGEDLLRQRARQGTAKTTVILQHYPELGNSTRQLFEDALSGRQTKVIGAYGHAHDQMCMGRDASGNCDMVLTGGGGGCCMANYGGFTAVHLNADGGFTTDVESGGVRLPRGSCQA
jgi:hypothetical protein